MNDCNVFGSCCAEEQEKEVEQILTFCVIHRISAPDTMQCYEIFIFIVSPWDVEDESHASKSDEKIK